MAVCAPGAHAALVCSVEHIRFGIIITETLGYRSRISERGATGDNGANSVKKSEGCIAVRIMAARATHGAGRIGSARSRKKGTVGADASGRGVEIMPASTARPRATAAVVQVIFK